MFFPENEVAIVEQVRDEKAEKMIEYIRSLKYKEQKRELKADFKRQGWLTGDEISMTVKAYRMMKADVDVDELVKVYDQLVQAARGGK
jgi:hypothetical protein